MQTLGIFQLDAGNAHHAARLRLAAQMTDQSTNHPVGIDPIRLRLPRPPVYLQATRIENMVVNAVSFEHAMQPKPVIPRLVARHHLDWSAQLPRHPRANPLNQLEQPVRVACFHLIPTGLVAQRRLKSHDPTGLAQFDCNEAMHRLIIHTGGRGVLHADFHWSLLCGWWWFRNRTGTTSPAAPA